MKMMDKISELYKTKIRKPIIKRELDKTKNELACYEHLCFMFEPNYNKPTSFFGYSLDSVYEHMHLLTAEQRNKVIENVDKYICFVTELRNKITELEEKESRLLNKLGIQNAN